MSTTHDSTVLLVSCCAALAAVGVPFVGCASARAPAINAPRPPGTSQSPDIDAAPPARVGCQPETPPPIRSTATFRRVARIITENLDVPEKDICPESTFIDDLGADSLGLVELVLATEEEFEIDIPDEDTEKLRTVRDVVVYLDARQSSTHD
jgi:acyl carrier protein